MSVQWSSLFGGLGLFLWGMYMLSQGLRLAAGSALENLLGKATGTRGRGLITGAVTTAIVQSSSAVTVATLGFVNAGLLTLGSAIWVLFGANLGTTATGWIVALAGLKLDLSVVSLPLIAIGATMKLAGSRAAIAAWGEAIAGFGMLFYGIVLMQTGFVDVFANWQIPQAQGIAGTALQVFAGLIVTVVMQSSSASTAIALTAAQTGLIDVTAAAAVVIGANVGTTVTAVLASVGATPNAKRVAAAHILFNIVTATAAFMVLPFLLPMVSATLDWFDVERAPAIILAVFNTFYKTLGIVLMWPFADRLTQWLSQRFKADQRAGVKPVFLDQTTLMFPGLAIRALASELHRTLDLVRDSLQMTVCPAPDTGQTAQRVQPDSKRLLVACEEFVDQLNREGMDADTAQRLAYLLRVRRYLENVLDNTALIMSLPNGALTDAGFEVSHSTYLDGLQALLANTWSEDDAQIDRLTNQYETAYQALKHSILQAGAVGVLATDRMETVLSQLSAQRHATQQLMKAKQWLQRANEADDGYENLVPAD